MADVDDPHETDLVGRSPAQVRRMRAHSALDLAPVTEEIEKSGSERRCTVRSSVRAPMGQRPTLDPVLDPAWWPESFAQDGEPAR